MLTSDSDIVFDHFASELNLVNWPSRGLVRCREAGCVDGVHRLPVFRFITFDLGHNFCVVSHVLNLVCPGASLIELNGLPRAEH